MKSSNYPTRQFLLILFFFIFIFLGNKTYAQDCDFPQASKVLKGNNISANILNGGDLFWDRSNASFFSETNPTVASVFNAGIWIGGFIGLNSSSPNLELSASHYPSSNNSDYRSGPLDINGSVTQENCENFDRLWEVFGSEIAAHIADFEDDGVVSNQFQNIYAYPAHQNPFFNDFHNFSLPNTPQGLAPFFDRDGDGIYNPDNGDFPLPSSVNKDVIPEHLIWGIFNDNGSNHTLSQGANLQFEIQLTAWAFSCSDNEVLNNTIFTSHKIINRASSSIDSLHVGMFVDFDLGCFTDDYVGSIPNLNTFYVYNSDEVDGDNGFCPQGVDTYASNPPVQAVTYLNHEMSSFLTTAPSDPPLSGVPNLPAEFFNLLTGSWTDGTPITKGGNGYNSGGQPTSFLFDDNPNDPDGWSMTTAEILDGDFRTVSSVDIDGLNPGQTTTMDMAYTFYQDANLNNVETVNLVYEKTPLLKVMYNNQFQTVCSATTSVENNIIEKNNIQLFPNPTTHLLNVKLENPQAAAFEVFDIHGRIVFEKAESFNSSFQLPIEHLSEGIYFLKIKMDDEEVVQKFIKI